MFDLLGKEFVKSIITNLLGGQKIKLQFEPPEGKMRIHHIKPDGSNHTYDITFEEVANTINNKE